VAAPRPYEDWSYGSGPVSTVPGRAAPLGGTAGALKRYRIMANVVGVGLATVVFVGIPLQLIGHNKWPWNSVVEIVGTLHGFFYIAYLVVCLDLASRARFRMVQLLGMVCSGLLPLLAFYMERKVTQRVEAQLALGPDAPPGPAATVLAVLTGRSRAARESLAAEAVAGGAPPEVPDDPAVPGGEAGEVDLTGPEEGLAGVGSGD